MPCAASPLAALGGRDVERLPTASTCYSTLKVCERYNLAPGGPACFCLRLARGAATQRADVRHCWSERPRLLLQLPNYRRAGTLKKKLMQAIHAAAGFELS